LLLVLTMPSLAEKKNPCFLGNLCRITPKCNLYDLRFLPEMGSSF
jgi:hypothetical protein